MNPETKKTLLNRINALNTKIDKDLKLQLQDAESNVKKALGVRERVQKEINELSNERDKIKEDIKAIDIHN